VFGVESESDGVLTVVALLTLGAVTAHVAETAARVAGGLRAACSSAVATSVAASEATTSATAAEAAATVAATLGAVAGDVADLTALVALLATSRPTGAAESAARLGVRALTGQVGRLATVVACLVFGQSWVKKRCPGQEEGTLSLAGSVQSRDRWPV